MELWNAFKSIFWGQAMSSADLASRSAELAEVVRTSDASPEEQYSPELPANVSQCTKAVGAVTGMCNHSGTIDGLHLIHKDTPRPADLKVGDRVEYLYFQPEGGARGRVVEVLSVVDDFAGPPEREDFHVDRRKLIDTVAARDGRRVLLAKRAIWFSLDKVAAGFVPAVGDWLALQVTVQLHNQPTSLHEDDFGAVLEVHTMECLRSTEVNGNVTHWDPESEVGVIDDHIFFTKGACETGYQPQPQDSIVVDAIESDQGRYSWRAITVAPLALQPAAGRGPRRSAPPESSKGIQIKENLSFGTMTYGESKTLVVEVHNRGTVSRDLVRGTFLGQRGQSQLQLVDGTKNYGCLAPNSKVHFTFRCTPVFLGYSEETFAFTFRHCTLKRRLKVHVVDSESWAKVPVEPPQRLSYATRMRSNLEGKSRLDAKHLVLGRRKVFSPNFVSVRMPPYNIPASYWETVNNYFSSGSKVIPTIEDSIPELSADLRMDTYVKKFHALLYLEEIDHQLRIRKYDMESFLIASGEYLALEVAGLAERRPSLLVGDNVRVARLSGDSDQLYEGYIHKMGDNRVFLQMDPQFHASYNGEDLSVHFMFNRACFLKSHFAIDLAKDRLGKELLFPTQLNIKPKQVDILEPTDEIREAAVNRLKSKRRRVEWFNGDLNTIQKMAVRNILEGVARPLPYILFGPPGTGKTVTLIEAVLQLFHLLPDSRILVTTPSNSSANLFTERLIAAGKFIPGDLLRLIAYHVAMSGNLPENLKPFCATADISMENSNNYNNTYRVRSDGVRENCQKSAIVNRHRIIIGTCNVISSLCRQGMSRGHFTHILVDEAGQATEPEVMIPLVLVGHEGQIVLAGDPMQLGPISINKTTCHFGLSMSYLERILSFFPYQRDPHNYNDEFGGYDPRLVTRLTMNYRSIPRLLALPSSMFYDGSLRSQVQLEEEWVAEALERLRRVLGLSQDTPFPGLVFHGVRGHNMQAAESPSWYNPHEASMVVMYTVRLYNEHFSPDDIGIITPYIQQIQYLRRVFSGMDLECPKIGTVEEFQGQERRIILLSSVRTSSDLLTQDALHSLGFLCNPKRLNVSLTRAKIMLLLFGDPQLLATDPHWRRVLVYALNAGHYMGCHLPPDLAEES